MISLTTLDRNISETLCVLTSEAEKNDHCPPFRMKTGQYSECPFPVTRYYAPSGFVLVLSVPFSPAVNSHFFCHCRIPSMKAFHRFTEGLLHFCLALPMFQANSLTSVIFREKERDLFFKEKMKIKDNCPVFL